ncbi:hypothetical protein Tco_0175164 [Tanacetum coccineum]
MVLRPLMEAQLLPWQMTTIPIGNTGGPREIPVSKKRKNYKIHKMATFLLQWYGRSSWPHSLFDAVWKSRYFSIDCAEEIKVTFCYDQANQITWTQLKRLLTNKYCPRTKVKKMEDEFYKLVVKGNDHKTYIRRLSGITVLCQKFLNYGEEFNIDPENNGIQINFFPPEKISPPKDAETPVESPILISPSSSVRSSSPVRSTTSPPDYPFNESLNFYKLVSRKTKLECNQSSATEA